MVYDCVVRIVVSIEWSGCHDSSYVESAYKQFRSHHTPSQGSSQDFIRRVSQYVLMAKGRSTHYIIWSIIFSASPIHLLIK